jgi:hypothetical protein
MRVNAVAAARPPLQPTHTAAATTLLLSTAAVLLPTIDLPYFLGLGVLTVYIGAHRGLTSKSRQQLTVKEVSVCVVIQCTKQGRRVAAGAATAVAECV